MRLTGQWRNIISGLIALVLLAGVTTIAIKYSFGYFDPGYKLEASFESAGQGLVREGDVKMRGINIGHVESIRLEDGRALVTLFIDEGTDVPTSTTAVIRPKTLFGEKFVDLVPGDLEGTDEESELYADGDRIENTMSAVELERVLAETYPILEAINPDDVATVLGELAIAADGMGPSINRQLVNSALLLDVQAANDDNTRRFLEDLALLTDELATRAPDLIAGARDLNVALPALTGDGDALTALLVELERLADDFSSLLEGNTAFIDASYTAGQATLDTLFANRAQLIPLVVGLRQYSETVAGVARIPVGDGTLMAAVKGITGGEPCEFIVCPGVEGGASAATATEAPAADAPAAEPVTPTVGILPGVIDGHVSSGTQAVLDLLTGLTGRPS